jgi:LysR family transcriptional regulator, glycine cleavage system transcriptional activator
MSTSRKRLPPLQNLEAFEAAARHLSFTRAAEEINLSQSAVSRQIKHLEESMGVRLFTRSHKTLDLTKAGRTLLNGIERSLAELRRTVETIENDRSPTVTISASMAIASFWLLPGIAEFKDRHPHIRVRVIAGDGEDYAAVQNNETDFTILYDQGQRGGHVSVGLFEEVIFPACTPAYLKGRNVYSLQDLSREKLIDFEVKHLRTVKGWPDWFSRAGCETRGINYTLSVSNYDLACRAALAGQGVVLMWAYVAPLADFANGTLLRPVGEVVNTGHVEYLVYGKALEESSAHMVFKDWILEYARRTNDATRDFLGLVPQG